MNLIQRYRLSVLLLTTLLVVLALAYAVQSATIRVLRTRNHQLKRENRHLKAKSSRQLDAANSAVYRYVLQQMTDSYQFTQPDQVLYIDVADEDVCASYSGRGGFVCSTPSRTEAELHYNRRKNDADYAMMVSAPVWNGESASVRVVLHNSAGAKCTWNYFVTCKDRRVQLNYAVGSSDSAFRALRANPEKR